MGLCAHAKGLTDETEFNCGYLTYRNFIRELIKIAYDEKCCQIFDKLGHDKLSDSDITYWNEHCNDDLDILIWHSDCSGKFIPQECRKIYNAIKDLKSNMQGHNYGVMRSYNMLEHWKNIFKHCVEKRVNLYYS